MDHHCTPPLQIAIIEFIRAVTGEGAFSNANHLLALREEMCDRQKIWYVVNDSKIKDLVVDLDSPDQWLTICAKNKGVCMNVGGTTLAGTLLAATEFCDLVCACYDVTPHNLQSKCDGCDTSFDVRHILICSKVDLVIARHNKIHGGILYLARRALSSASECGKPLIHQVHIRS